MTKQINLKERKRTEEKKIDHGLDQGIIIEEGREITGKNQGQKTERKTENIIEGINIGKMIIKIRKGRNHNRKPQQMTCLLHHLLLVKMTN